MFKRLFKQQANPNCEVTQLPMKCSSCGVSTISGGSAVKCNYNPPNHTHKCTACKHERAQRAWPR